MIHDKLQQAHDILDKLNGEHGDLCLYCDAQKYNGKVGIIHKKSCIITQLRELINNVYRK